MQIIPTSLRTVLACAVALALAIACNGGPSGPPPSSADRVFIDAVAAQESTFILAAAQARASAVHPELVAWALNFKYGADTRIDTLQAYKRAWFGTSALPAGTAPVTIAGDANFDLRWIQAMLAATSAMMNLTAEPNRVGLRAETFNLGHVIFDENQVSQDRLRAFAKQWYGVTL